MAVLVLDGRVGAGWSWLCWMHGGVADPVGAECMVVLLLM
jgi:hypothetical protein